MTTPSDPSNPNGTVFDLDTLEDLIAANATKRDFERHALDRFAAFTQRPQGAHDMHGRPVDPVTDAHARTSSGYGHWRIRSNWLNVLTEQLADGLGDTDDTNVAFEHYLDDDRGPGHITATVAVPLNFILDNHDDTTTAVTKAPVVDTTDDPTPGQEEQNRREAAVVLLLRAEMPITDHNIALILDPDNRHVAVSAWRKAAHDPKVLAVPSSVNTLRYAAHTLGLHAYSTYSTGTADKTMEDRNRREAAATLLLIRAGQDATPEDIARLMDPANRADAARVYWAAIRNPANRAYPSTMKSAHNAARTLGLTTRDLHIAERDETETEEKNRREAAVVVLMTRAHHPHDQARVKALMDPANRDDLAMVYRDAIAMLHTRNTPHFLDSTHSAARSLGLTLNDLDASPVAHDDGATRQDLAYALILHADEFDESDAEEVMDPANRETALKAYRASMRLLDNNDPTAYLDRAELHQAASGLGLSVNDLANNTTDPDHSTDAGTDITDTIAYAVATRLTDLWDRLGLTAHKDNPKQADPETPAIKQDNPQTDIRKPREAGMRTYEDRARRYEAARVLLIESSTGHATREAQIRVGHPANRAEAAALYRSALRGPASRVSGGTRRIHDAAEILGLTSDDISEPKDNKGPTQDKAQSTSQDAPRPAGPTGTGIPTTEELTAVVHNITDHDLRTRLASIYTPHGIDAALTAAHTLASHGAPWFIPNNAYATLALPEYRDGAASVFANAVRTFHPNPAPAEVYRAAHILNLHDADAHWVNPAHTPDLIAEARQIADDLGLHPEPTDPEPTDPEPTDPTRDKTGHGPTGLITDLLDGFTDILEGVADGLTPKDATLNARYTKARDHIIDTATNSPINANPDTLANALDGIASIFGVTPTRRRRR